MDGPSIGRGEQARSHAKRLLAQAELYDKGDEGEWATARLLQDLPDEWVVLHRVVPPDHRWDVDHLLIGPGGLIALDSKNYSGRVQVANGTLRNGKYPRSRELDAARDHANHVAGILGMVVVPALCIHTAQLPASQFTVQGMDVVAPDRLVSWLRGRAPVLLDMQVVALAAAARQRLEVRGLPRMPIERTAAPPPIAALPDPVLSAPSPRPVVAAARGPSRRVRPRAKSRRVEKLVSEALTGILVIAFVSWYAPRWGRSIAKSAPKPPVTTPASDAPLHPPALQAGSFSCASRGGGWTFNVPWPGDQGGLTTYQAQWSQSLEGPWSQAPVWQRGASLSISGLRPAGRVFVRATATRAGAQSPESMAMQKTPAGAC